MNKRTAQRLTRTGGGGGGDNPHDNLKLFMMDESFSNRWGSRIAVVGEGRETCATTRKVVRSNRTTSSAPKTSAKDLRCASMSSVFGIRTLTIVDHALLSVKKRKIRQAKRNDRMCYERCGVR